jgi:hypothetical protein
MQGRRSTPLTISVQLGEDQACVRGRQLRRHGLEHLGLVQRAAAIDVARLHDAVRVGPVAADIEQ